MEQVIYVGQVNDEGRFDSLAWGKVMSLFEGMVESVIVSSSSMEEGEVEVMFGGLTVTMDEELSEEGFHHYWVADGEEGQVLEAMQGDLFGLKKGLSHVVFMGGGMMLGSLEVEEDEGAGFLVLGDLTDGLVDEWFEEAAEDDEDGDVYDRYEDFIEELVEGADWIGLE